MMRSKRFLSLLLTVLVLVGVFPVQAAAGENNTAELPAETVSLPGDPSALAALGTLVTEHLAGENDGGYGPEEEQGSGSVPTDPDAGQNDDPDPADRSGSSPDENPGMGDDVTAPSEVLENAPAPGSDYVDEEEPDSEDADNNEDQAEDPAKLGLKFEDGAEYVLEPVRGDVNLAELDIRFREWGEEEETRYFGKLPEVRRKENEVFSASMRDANGESIVFDTLVEFTLSCEDWKGRSLGELNAMELSLYLTNGDEELGDAQILFNYWDGHPALFFSTDRLADLLLTEANEEEKARLAAEREEAEAAEPEEQGIGDGKGNTEDPGGNDGGADPETEYPELTYHETVDGMVVDIAAPAGAFPAGTRVVVTAVEEERVLPAVEAAVQEAADHSAALVDAKVLQVRALDITFLDADGEEHQPLLPISVVLCPEEAPEETHDLAVIHIDGEGNGKAVEELERSGEEVSFSAESFSTYVYTSVLMTCVLDSEGNSWKAGVTYDSRAQIPDGAILNVEEIGEDAQDYAEYAASAAELLAVGEGELRAIRLFDISILDADGRPVEPAETVKVSISLDEPLPADDGCKVGVLHFTGDEPEFITPEFDSGEHEDSAEAVAETAGEVIVFETASFSRYAFVTYEEEYEALDGKTYSVFRYEGRKGWAMQGVPVGESPGDLAYVECTSETRSTKTYFNSSGPDVTLWSFEQTDGENRYYIRDNSSGQYLNIAPEGLSLSDEPQAITVTNRVTKKNNWKLSAGEYYVSWTGDGYAVSNTASDCWFRLADLEPSTEEQAVYTATKYDCGEMQEADRIVIYHTFYNPLSGKYELYVIDGNGNAVRAYDDGGRLTLHSAVSPVWKMTICRREDGTPNGYYIFQNEETELVLAPSANDLVEPFESYDTSGVVLNGRPEQHNSTIEKWDDSVNLWYGYQLDTEYGRVVFTPAPNGEDLELSFARIIDSPTGELHPVATVDSASHGVKINLFDYGGGGTPWKDYASDKDRNTWISSVMGDHIKYIQNAPAKGEVSRTLGADGFPTFKNGNSAAGLLGPDSRFYLGSGNHLFLAAPYSATGYYSYSCFHNYAHWEGENFTVYEEIASAVLPRTEPHKRGHYFPFNTIDPTRLSLQGYVNTYDERLTPLDYEDPNLGEPIYQVGTGVKTEPEPVDYFFGMTVDCDFMMPPDGLQNGDPIIYEFTGDDDLWIYVDGVLLLDLGGVHQALNGTINFATGQIIGSGVGNNDNTIKKCFRLAGVFPDGSPWDDSRVDDYFKGETFRDYGSHSFKMLYMEHGAGASNLEMRFNLPVVEEGRFAVEKRLSGTAQEKYANVEFAYQAFAKVDGAVIPLIPGITLAGMGSPVEVTDESSGKTVPFHDDVIFGGDSYDGVFYLKPDEAAVFKNVPEGMTYYVREIGVLEGYYDEVRVNGIVVGNSGQGPYGIYQSPEETVQNRLRVMFSNKVSEGNSNSLLINKALQAGSGDNGDKFEFRILMENTAGELVPYNQGTYYIRKDGSYYRFVDGELVNNGDTPVAYQAGQYGTVNKIPIGFTVEVPELLTGTAFYVDEIRLPDGWYLSSKEYTPGSYDPISGGLSGEAWDYDVGANRTYTADGQIKYSTDAEVTFTNGRAVDVSVTKIWVDEGRHTGDRPDSVTVFLLANGEPLRDRTAVLKPDGEGNWPVYTWHNLPGKTASGSEIVYTVREQPVPGYSSAVTGSMSEGFTVINSRLTEVDVRKVWDDNHDLGRKRPAEVKIILLADGRDTGRSLSLSRKNGWKGSFTDLDVYADGKKIVYTVSEDPVSGYKKPVITGDAAKGFTVTNSILPPPSPKTGDDTQQWPWMTSMLLSAGLLITDSLLRERKRKRTARRRN